jgi:hypothetical protein
MRIFKSKWFAKFARKSRIEDDALKTAVAEIDAGNFDADLGGYVYKQRVARRGRGKSSGYRTILVYKQGERAFFVYGFAKNKLENITDDYVKYYKDFAKTCINFSVMELENAINSGDFIEI